MQKAYNQMLLRGVFFDAAGTLFEPARPVGESYASLAETYGMRVSAQELSHRFELCFRAAPPLAFPGASAHELTALERSWWKELVQNIFEPYGRFERFDDYFADLFTYFGRPTSWALYPDTQATLLALKRRGLILVVVSNFDSRVDHILGGLGIGACFDSIIISSRVGYAKPAPEIFHAALRAHELLAEEVWHVGDSPEYDAAGAIAAGLRAVLVNRRRSPLTDGAVHVKSLNELPMLAGLSLG